MLPFHLARANRAFADIHLDVDIVPVESSRPLADQIDDGDVDVCFQAIGSYLSSPIPSHTDARFICIIHHSSPLGVFVRAGSDWDEASISNATVTTTDGWLFGSYQRALLDRGQPAPPPLAGQEPGDGPVRLFETGVVDGFLTYIDIGPQAWAIPTRAVRLGTDIYASGVIASGRVDAELAAPLAAVILGEFARQAARSAPSLDLAARQFSGLDPDFVSEGIDRLSPFLAPPSPADPVRMSRTRWERTLSWHAAAGGEPATAVNSIVERALCGE